MMIGLISNFSRVHEVVDDNNNPYRNMVMDPKGMNHSYIGQCSIINEEPQANAVRFFLSFKRL